MIGLVQTWQARPSCSGAPGRRLAMAVLVCLMLVCAGVARAEEKKGHEAGNLIRTTVMVPLLNPGTTDIARILPVTIEVNFDSEEAKNAMVNSIPKLQDAYIQGTYGKAYTNWGYDSLQNLFTKITLDMAPGDIRSQVHVSIRLNVKQQ